MADQNRIKHLEEKVKALEKSLSAKGKICEVLTKRVERSIDSVGGAYSIFERNILLQNLVDQRSGQIEDANKKLSQEINKRITSEQRLHSVIQGSPIPTFVIEKDHRVIYWNKALEELSGVEVKEVVGTTQHWRAFYKEERPCMADLLVDELLDAIPQWYSDKYIKSKLLEGAYEATDFFPELGNGGKWLRFTAARIRDSQGDLVGAIETLEDITERKQAEEMSRQSEEKFHKIFMMAPDGIAITRMKDGLLIDGNKGYEDIVGWKRSEVIGRTSIEYDFWVNPTDRDSMVHELKSGRDVLHCEFQFLRSDGSPRTGIYSARPIQIAGEACLMFILNDITERKRAEEERQRLQGQLIQAQKMQAIGTLAGGIAHDFNNILGAILGYTEMALIDPKVDNRLRRYLEQVFKAGERAKDLVKQILAFSRQSDEKLRPLRINPIIKEVFKLLRASLPSTIKIRQDICSDADTVLADPTHVHQILMNLCTNAAHAMRERKGELKVSLVPVEVKPGDTLIIHHDLSPGMYLKLTVSDTGVGIDPDIMGRIFDPFFTTKKTGEGTGMGLSVVHGIVKSYHGAITVESEVGKGTDFHIYLPLLKEAGEKREVEAAAHTTGGKERILFVDDEEMLVELGKSMLTGLGYDVIGRTSSLEALKLFQARPERFDLVITDMTMPNMTGVELARELMRIRPAIPVILCTGFSEAITPERVKFIGLRELIMKPIIRRQVAEAIRRVLDQKE